MPHLLKVMIGETDAFPFLLRRMKWILLGLVMVRADIFKTIGTARPTSVLLQEEEEVKGPISSSFDQNTILPPVNLGEGIVLQRAIPTNAWWGNLIAKDDLLRYKPIYCDPFRIEIDTTEGPFGIRISYPHQYLFKGPLNENGAIRYYGHGLGMMNLGFSATAFKRAPKLQVTDWDDIGVHAVLKHPQGQMDADFVRGMAYVSTRYSKGLTPVLMTDHAITRVKRSTEHKHIVSLNNGQKWVVFSSKPIEFTQQGQRLVANGTWNGILRVALLTDRNPDETQYDDCATCQVIGGNAYATSSQGYSIKWKTAGVCENGLLHFALDHHMKSIRMDDVQETSSKLHAATHGPMSGIVTRGLEWQFTEPASVDIGFYPPRTPSQQDIEHYKILDQLKQDIRRTWNIPRKGSYYFNGKLAQKYATLCLLAANPVLVGDDTSLKAECVSKLQGIYNHYLDNTWTYPLVYDEVYRGIVSSEAFVEDDPWRDFGNSVYNDHHFHYGYWIAAGAMLRHLDPSWSRMPDLERMVELMLRDTANPSEDDKWFPRFRHFDWYVGHSYSHGVSPFADGKDQESTSEEMNFHYGVMLWGQVTENSELMQMGQLMLKLNSRAINTYFLMTDDNIIHPKEFIKNKVTGIFFDNKVDYATWFGPKREFIHGIQMIPVSPINEIFRKEEFVHQEWEQVLSKIDIITDPEIRTPWQSLLYSNVATIDKKLALEKLSQVPMDDGLSRAWALYFAATRPVVKQPDQRHLRLVPMR